MVLERWEIVYINQKIFLYSGKIKIYFAWNIKRKVFERKKDQQQQQQFKFANMSIVLYSNFMFEEHLISNTGIKNGFQNHNFGKL